MSTYDSTNCRNGKDHNMDQETQDLATELRFERSFPVTIRIPDGMLYFIDEQAKAQGICGTRQGIILETMLHRMIEVRRKEHNLRGPGDLGLLEDLLAVEKPGEATDKEAE